VRFDRLPVARPTLTHVTRTARGWPQRRSAAGRSAPSPDYSGSGTCLAVNEVLRPPAHRAQELSRTIPRFFFSRPDTLPPTGLSGIFMSAGDLVVSQQDGPRRVSLAAGLYPLADSREAPACMRCRGLTGPQHAINLPIPRLIQALPDRHLANSPPAISGPPASRNSRGCPRGGLLFRW
jgi:hypothetical protein